MQGSVIAAAERFSTAEVAKMAGVHRDTLLRWLRTSLVPEPDRDRHGWRYFNREQADAVRAFASSSTDLGSSSNIPPAALTSLDSIDWDFNGAKTSYLTHGIHPYPAKYIPQIPNALIQELSAVGDLVADIFCGSGTTLVEALSLKRHAIGIDANPLACLISKAKTGFVSEQDATSLLEIANRAREMGERLAGGSNGEDIPYKQAELFPSPNYVSQAWRPSSDSLQFWFEPSAIEELAECLSWCRILNTESAKTLALTAFSSIVVTVSRQDSDTRYVRREKQLTKGEVFRRFARALEQVTRSAVEFSELAEARFRCQILQADILLKPDVEPLDLVVCSPPYPNAFSYHLYHMTRMLWLGMDQPRFKKEEIGSHRKYSNPSKNRATADTFRTEFSAIMDWLGGRLKKGRYACFVVGDSTLQGERINNADLIAEASRPSGFVEVRRIHRTLQTTKKSFNPSIGKIKTEAILVLQNKGSI
jgi:site-specific DNA-methyltransferase (cytosine-N4-specific)